MKQFNRHPDLSGLSLGFEYYNTKTKRRYRFTGDVTNPWQEIVDLTQEELDELKENQGGMDEVKVDGSTITKSSKGELQLGKTVGYNQEIKTEGKIIHTGDGFYSESIRDNIISSIDVNGANDISVNLGVNNYDNDSYVSGTNIIVSEERIKLSVDTHDNKLHSITISEKGIESTLTIDNNIFDGKVVTVPFLDSILSSIEIPNQELAGTVNDGTNDYSRINSSYNYYGFKCENYEGDLETLGQIVSNTEFLLPVIPLDKLKEGSPIKNTLVTSVNDIKADKFGNITIPSSEVKVDNKTISLNEDGELQIGYVIEDDTEKLIIELDKDKNPQVTTINYKNIDELLLGEASYDGVSLSKNGIYGGKYESNEEHRFSISNAGISLKKGYAEIDLNAYGFTSENRGVSKYLSVDFNKITYQQGKRERRSLVYPLLKEHLEERVIPVSVNGIFSDNEGNIDIPSPEVISDGKTVTLNDKGEIQLGVSSFFTDSKNKKTPYIDIDNTQPINFNGVMIGEEDFDNSQLFKSRKLRIDTSLGSIKYNEIPNDNSNSFSITNGGIYGSYKGGQMVGKASYSITPDHISLYDATDGTLTAELTSYGRRSIDAKGNSIMLPDRVGIGQNIFRLPLVIDGFVASRNGIVTTGYKERIEALEKENNTLLISPDGKKWKLGVDNNGNLITTKAE